MIFDTKVSGIPCRCKVVSHIPGTPMVVFGPEMADAHPPIGAEFDFTLLDRKGYRAVWLEKKLTENDTDRLLEEFSIEQLGERYGYLT